MPPGWKRIETRRYVPVVAFNEADAVEELAAALCIQHQGDDGKRIPWSEVPDDAREKFRHNARAVLETAPFRNLATPTQPLQGSSLTAEHRERLSEDCTCDAASSQPSTRWHQPECPLFKAAASASEPSTVERFEPSAETLDGHGMMEASPRGRWERGDRANDLQARLEKAEEERDIERMVAGEGSEVIGCLRNELAQAEAALEEAATEFEQQAETSRKRRLLAADHHDMISQAFHGGTQQAHLESAHLLREQQAALRGGTDGD